MTELYLIRHGESDMNTKSHLIGGRSNETPLTEKGIAQAEQLGRYFLQEHIVPDQVYASPAIRTRHTALHTLKAMGIDTEPLIDDRLQELEQGEWVGQNRTIIYNDEVLADIAAQGKDFKSPGGESMNEVGERMLEWVESTIDTSENRRVFVFTHGFAIRCLASILHGWSHAETYGTKTDNASVSLFTNRTTYWQLSYIGRNFIR